MMETSPDQSHSEQVLLWMTSCKDQDELIQFISQYLPAAQNHIQTIFWPQSYD